MDNNYKTAANSAGKDTLTVSKKHSFLFALLIIAGFITTFLSGYFLSTLLKSEPEVTSSTAPTPVITGEKVPDEVDPSTLFLAGKFYFDDTLIMVSEDEPHYSIVATANRSQKDVGYLQNTRVSFFDGSKWTRQIRSDTNTDSGIHNNNIIKAWNINFDGSKVLRQVVKGGLQLNAKEVSFSTETLQNEMTIRSLPGYTKFSSEGKGKMIIDGQEHQAHVLYTRIYSFDASQLIVYDSSVGLITYWVAFWDSNGNFFHIDKTEVTKAVENYSTHSIGILKDIKGRVNKSFNIQASMDQSASNKKYQFSMSSPINYRLNLEQINSIDKAPSSAYTWYMGQIKGTSEGEGETKTDGFGIIEYIRK